MFNLTTHDVYQEIQTEWQNPADREIYIARLYTLEGEEKERITGTGLNRSDAILEACTQLHKQFDIKYPEKT